jgi:hypothetical protein
MGIATMISEATGSCGSKVAAWCAKLGGSHICHYVKEIRDGNRWQVVCVSSIGEYFGRRSFERAQASDCSEICSGLGVG